MARTLAVAVPPLLRRDATVAAGRTGQSAVRSSTWRCRCGASPARRLVREGVVRGTPRQPANFCEGSVRNAPRSRAWSTPYPADDQQDEATRRPVHLDQATGERQRSDARQHEEGRNGRQQRIADSTPRRTPDRRRRPETPRRHTRPSAIISERSPLTRSRHSGRLHRTIAAIGTSSTDRHLHRDDAGIEEQVGPDVRDTEEDSSTTHSPT